MCQQHESHGLEKKPRKKENSPRNLETNAKKRSRATKSQKTTQHGHHDSMLLLLTTEKSGEPAMFIGLSGGLCKATLGLEETNRINHHLLLVRPSTWLGRLLFVQSRSLD